MSTVERELARGRERVNAALERWLPAAGAEPARLTDAMRYAVLGGGKRLRPALVYTTGEALDAPGEWLDPPACAVELIHAYSLAHDDLPAMDDDDLRRGAPTCHRRFDEATAILAGDALQALAFELLSADDYAGDLPSAARARMVATLAAGAGVRGMAGGQAIDLAACGRQLALEEVERMHRFKTGALIETSVLLGALAGEADRDTLERLQCYGGAIGLAFQIVDDILDLTVDTATLGKAQGADLERGKPTHPAAAGLDASRRRAEQLRDEALGALESLDDAFDPLRELAAFVVDRSW